MEADERDPLDWYPGEEMPLAVQRMLALNDVVVVDGRRPLGDVTGLTESIREVGLLNPITVTSGLRLVAGYHRLEACRRLGWREIPATVCSLDDLHAELAEIDENLIRTEIDVLERSEQYARRKQVYEAIHPETTEEAREAAGGRIGGRGRVMTSIGVEIISPPMAKPAFVQDTAEKTGVTPRSVKQDVQIATAIPADVKDTIRGTPLADNKTALLKLARKTPDVQRAIVAVADFSEPKAIERAEHKVRSQEKQAKATEQIKEAPQVDVQVEVGDATALPLDDCSVDVILTSPPYGLDKPYHGQDDLAAGWEDFMEDWLRESYRVAREPARLILNVPLDTARGGYRPTWPQACAAAAAAGWEFRATILWDKMNSTKGGIPLGSEDSANAPHPVAEVEVIGLFYKGTWKLDGDRPSDISHEEFGTLKNGLWRLPGESRGWEGHPAPFPEELVRRLLTYLTRVGDTVLDPFSGSGTTALVAWQHKRIPIGFDLSEEYVASARRRIAREQERIERESATKKQPDLDLFASASEQVGEQRGAAAGVGLR